MTRPDRHNLVCELFLEICDVDPAEQEQRLLERCGSDPELLEEVRAMLRADGDARLRNITTAQGILRDQVLDDLEPQPVPERIGPFQILGVLGQGGMGVVYHAQQDRPKRQVALKVIRPGLLGEKALARFEHEIEVLAKMQHPGIARLYEMGTHEQDGVVSPYFAMEFVHGQDLLSYARAEELDVGQRLALFTRVCDAVHHAHLRGVIHRDLKPANILVDAEGQPRILDFGIARITDSDNRTLTMTGDVSQLIGTIPYMSPEQAGGEFRDLDARSDVYALGVILYELLAGDLPYPVRDTAILEAVRVVRERDPRPLREYDRHLDRDVDAIVNSALDKDRGHRYQSASEFSADILRYLNHEPIVARSAGTLYHLSKFARRHKGLVASIALIVASLTAGLIVSTSLYVEAETAKVQARTHLQSYQRVHDFEVHSDLMRRADEELWPRRPERLAEFDAWLGEAHDLVARAPSHHQSLLEVEHHGQRDAGEGWTFDDPADRWLHERLTLLTGHMAAFQAAGGPLDRVAAHREIAEHVHVATLEEPAQAWEDCIDSIAISAAYGYLEITPQLGLIPLREDPASGLWEFFLWESGAPPELGDDDRWRIGDDTGLVFVLVPPTTFMMGASEKLGDPNYDRDSDTDEFPETAVTLDAFFLSKYEVTQGQWLRVMETNPSHHLPGKEFADEVITAAHPVGGLSWFMASKGMARLGLQLPTEAQWECAARAGTSTAWFTGSRAFQLEEFANLSDECARLSGERSGLTYETWNDGHAIHAAVGSYPPNPWGLHDVLGNMLEWCADPYSPYTEAPREGDGFRLDDPYGFRPVRGGSFFSSAIRARSRCRGGSRPESSHTDLGVRPVLALQAEL